MAINIGYKNKKGILVIEILIVIAVIGIAFSAIFGTIAFSLKNLNLLKETTRANVLAQETMEQVRNFRDETNWNNNGLAVLTTNVNYYPQKSGTPVQWQLVLGTELVDGFARRVVFENVNRDSSGNIIESGGTEDPDTKKVTVFISWQSQEIQVVTYLTNWK